MDKKHADITDAVAEGILKGARQTPAPQAPPKKRQVVSLFIVSVSVLLGLVVVTQIVSSLQEKFQPVNLVDIPELVVEEPINEEIPLEIEENKTIYEKYSKVHIGPVGCEKKTKLYSE